jgi:peptidoglycan hydrolase CwlO-like protein
MRKEIDDLQDSFDKLLEDVKSLDRKIDELKNYINEKYKIE